MRILLTTLNAKYIHINLAIRLLYELNQDHEGLEWKEFTIKESKDEVAKFCAAFDVVAFSCYIWNITQTLEVARKIKQLNPATQIMLGGPEVSYDWQDIIDLPEVDFIITGEGETPFRSFLQDYPVLDTVPNLVRKVAGEVIHFPKSEIFDLENYRGLQPYRHDPVEELRTKVLYIETSRGCPYKCEFCLASLDNKVRYLPNETIKAHLKYLMDHGRVIKFLDRTFNIKRDFTIDIFRFILDHYRPGNVFQFEITADIIHPEIIQFIHEHVPPGLFRFEIGIQTVNQKANLEVSRKQNFEKTKSIILQLQDKVEMHLDLIVGLALDYWEDIRYSFEEVFKLYPPELQLGFLKFLKGTPMRDKLDIHGFVFDSNPPYQIIESKYLSRDELHRIELLEHTLEIYWNKKRATNTLRYVTERYSIFDFLAGLGVFFSDIRPFYGHILEEAYTILDRFVKEKYPDDQVLHELVGIDYYLFHKTIPKPLFIQDTEKEEKKQVLETAGIDTSGFRMVLLPLHFDVDIFLNTFQVVDTPSFLAIGYDGITKALVRPLKPVPALL